MTPPVNEALATGQYYSPAPCSFCFLEKGEAAHRFSPLSPPFSHWHPQLRMHTQLSTTEVLGTEQVPDEE